MAYYVQNILHAKQNVEHSDSLNGATFNIAASDAQAKDSAPDSTKLSMHRHLHNFHIPVMGTGYSIDTPIRVAHDRLFHLVAHRGVQVMSVFPESTSNEMHTIASEPPSSAGRPTARHRE